MNYTLEVSPITLNSFEGYSLEQIQEKFNNNWNTDSAILLFANYKQGDYESDHDGTAVVIFFEYGELFLVHGSHCSCSGLDNQWEPDEITIEQLENYSTCEVDYYFAEIKESFEKCKVLYDKSN